MENKRNFERLVIAAYRLPFKFSTTKRGLKAVQNSGGLVSAILALSENLKNTTPEALRNKIIWAGTADNLPNNFSSQNFKNEHFEIVPVTIPSDLNRLYYGGFCNDMIWPLFHYFPSYSVFDSDYFKAYEQANKLFCEKLAQIIRPGDFIWLHDYQLFLLPQMLREKFPEATIGFFLHIPFPSFEIFRLMPRHWREAIIKGMLGADMIGFHTFDYAQHFMKSARRTLGAECRQNIIYVGNNFVKADAYPIGIDYDKFHQACSSPVVISEKTKVKAELKDQKLIFSVDRLDYSKGLLLRLKGYETFLENFPQWRGKVVFNMVVVPSRDNIAKYQEMRKEIEYTVGRINGKYSSLAWRPVIYQYKSLTFSELVALYDLSDVGLITPLRDGMNLVAKEYIACQVENPGVLILSEMTGAAAELSEALIINPADDGEMADAILYALEMDRDDKLLRLERMQNRISNYNVFTWANDFFNQTFETKDEQQLVNVKYVNRIISSHIILDYQKANKRIFFLDYDGTLVSFAKFPELATIEPASLQIVKKLTNDPNNIVVIISGRDKAFLEKQFNGLPIILVAEHGYFIKHIQAPWETTFNEDNKWKETVLPILNEYVNRCNGTFVEEKTGSLAWHYRNADSDFAQLRLNELKDELSEMIRHKTNLEILEGHKVLEIKSEKYDKGQAAKQLIKDRHFDFILASGDDKTDEDLFRAMPSNAISIRIGATPTLARYRVSDYTSLLKLLDSLPD
jgi:trehalose 6-phosphate synthase/phosphatase